jgi:two-component system phosphate regulon response regulator PhoB
MVLEEPSSEAKRRALMAGADDYMVGPLDVTRLLERIESLGGARPSGRQLLVNGPISLDPAAHQVRVDGRVVTIRPNEFRLLAHFIEHPDQVFSRAALIERLGKDGETIDERTVDVWVGRLRRALIAEGAPDPLRTVRSLGYVMDSIEA